MAKKRSDAESAPGNTPEMPPEIPVEGPPEPPVPPSTADPAWQDYVDTLFAPHECIDGRPRVGGLDRVCKLLIGEVLEEGPEVVQAPNRANNYHAVVKYSVVYHTPDLRTKRFSALGDCHPGNCEAAFARFAPQMAETRAKARAHRFALGYFKAAAEEVTTVPVEEYDLISAGQVRVLNHVGMVANLDVRAFVADFKRRHHVVDKWATVHDIPKAYADKMCQEVQLFQANKDTVPEELRGFKADWKG